MSVNIKFDKIFDKVMSLTRISLRRTINIRCLNKINIVGDVTCIHSQINSRHFSTLERIQKNRGFYNFDSKSLKLYTCPILRQTRVLCSGDITDLEDDGDLDDNTKAISNTGKT